MVCEKRELQIARGKFSPYFQLVREIQMMKITAVDL